MLFIMSSCSVPTFRRPDKSSKQLEIGVSGIKGNLNPFYATNEADRQINAQIFQTVQYRDVGNKQKNSAGNITYEVLDSGKVKYTVSIKDNLFFSDGTNVTIDDVIFFYYFISDATYTGVYKDFYRYDIEGIKEYYYDDPYYITSYADVTTESQRKRYIKANYSNGIDVTEISGIRRVDNYTCTVTFNSKNINAVSALNAVLVSSTAYSKEYVKGNAEAVKKINTVAVGSGRYCLSEYGTDKMILRCNPFCGEEKPAFTELIFKNTDESKLLDAVSDGKVDVATIPATAAAVKKLSGSNVKYYITNDDSYASLMFNTATLSDRAERKAIMGLCGSTEALDQNIGSYYTRVYVPLSIRYSEYPSDVSAAYYNESAYTTYLMLDTTDNNSKKRINIYYSGEETDFEYSLVSAYAEKLNGKNFTAKVTVTDDAGLTAAIQNGKADIWFAYVDDGYTCDKYDWYHSGGRKNLTGISNAELDALTEKMRGYVGINDRKSLEKEILDAVMTEAVEWPLFQTQNITVYNLDKINPESVSGLTGYDGYAQTLNLLY